MCRWHRLISWQSHSKGMQYRCCRLRIFRSNQNHRFFRGCEHLLISAKKPRIDSPVAPPSAIVWQQGYFCTLPPTLLRTTQKTSGTAAEIFVKHLPPSAHAPSFGGDRPIGAGSDWIHLDSCQLQKQQQEVVHRVRPRDYDCLITATTAATWTAG